MQNTAAIQEDLVFGLDMVQEASLALWAFRTERAFMLWQWHNRSMKRGQCLMDRYMIYIKSEIQSVK